MRYPSGSLSAGQEDRRVVLAEYWDNQRFGMLVRGKPLRDRDLDRNRVLAQNSCFMTSRTMLEDAVDLIMVDEDDLARRVLETAEFYLQTAIERDDVGAHRLVGQEVLGRSARLKFLTLVRWLRQRTLDLDSFRESVNMKKKMGRASRPEAVGADRLRPSRVDGRAAHARGVRERQADL
jgi:hypothetical protein